jgi:DNA mismatch repair protein MutH
MDRDELYDKTDPKSIEAYAQKLIGKKFIDVGDMELPTAIKEDLSQYENKSRKGGLGNFLEEQFFCYRANSDSEPDFEEAGVELKVTPYEKRGDGKLRAGERLVLTMISYKDPVEEDLYDSHLWHKCRVILLIYYLRDKSLKSNMLYHIDYAKLFTPPEKDRRIIEQDYQIIIEKIRSGQADKLSESDTNYLGACTKGATAKKSIVPQEYYAPDVMARRRAFCFKNAYMTSVLNSYIVPGKDTYQPIIKNADDLEGHTFETIVLDMINKYAGVTDKDLCAEFDVEYRKNEKSLWSRLVYRILGISADENGEDHAEEFEKANIQVKTIRLEESGKIKESMSFPTINFKKFAEEGWEDSDIYNYFSETKFLFVVFRKCGDTCVLKGAQFWNMPYDDLNITVKQGWEAIQKVVRDGVELRVVPWGDSYRVENNFPSKSDNEIIHIRPHAARSYNVLEDGTVYGNGTIADSDELPDGRRMTKQCFWLNNTYVLAQLDTELKK